MSNARWVQYKNDPQGKKFLVVEEGMVCWKIKLGTLLDHNCWVPKSEYTLCDPPEEWEDVTEAVAFVDTPIGFGSLRIDGVPIMRDRYRLRKIDCIHNGPAFIVEKRKT